MDEPVEETVGDRILLVREALQSRRKPLAMDRLAERLNELVGEKRYDGPKLSLIERGLQKITLEDIAAIAALDPQRRGRAWLAFGDSPHRPDPDAELPTATPRSAHGLEAVPSQDEKDREKRRKDRKKA